MTREEAEALDLCRCDVRVDVRRVTLDIEISGFRSGFVSLRCNTRETEVPIKDIVSIERVRPELPGGWEWSGDDAVWIEEGVVKGRVCVDALELLGKTRWHPVEIAKVIETVRKAGLS